MRRLWLIGVLAIIWSVGAGETAWSQVTLTVYLREAIREEYEWNLAMIREFEAANPDVKVEVVTEAGSAYADKLTVLWASGNPPDVWDQGGTGATYAQSGWLLDLVLLCRKGPGRVGRRRFLPGGLGGVRGRQARVGYSAHVGSQFSSGTTPTSSIKRASLFPLWTGTIAAGTWNGFARPCWSLPGLCRPGSSRRAGVALIHWWYLDLAYAWLFGGDWFDAAPAYETGVPEAVTFNSEANERAYQYFVDLLHQDRVAIDNYGTGDWHQRFEAALSAW